VIKSGISGHNKSVVLGALISAIRSIEIDKKNMELFEEIGNLAFLEG
jgi:hypothetical protein